MSTKQELIVRDVLEGLKALPDSFADMLAADPPYNMGFTYENHDDKMEPSAFVSWTARWMEELHRIAKPDAGIWLLVPDDMVHNILHISSRLKWHRINWIIWHYRFGVHTKSKFINSKTHLFWFTKSGEFRFNFDAVATASDRMSKYNDSRTFIKKFTPSGMRPPLDVWEWPRVVGNSKERVPEGPNQVPDELWFRAVDACTKPGDQVVEAFSGTGTLADVCARLDRNYIGFDNGPIVTAAAQLRLDTAIKFRMESQKNVPQS